MKQRDELRKWAGSLRCASLVANLQGHHCYADGWFLDLAG